MWFGCPSCLFRPERNKDMSNQNWNVFDVAKCPKCGTEMRLNFSDPPEQTKEA